MDIVKLRPLQYLYLFSDIIVYILYFVFDI